MSHVSVIDVSGLEVMEEQHSKLHAKGKKLVICGLSRQPLRVLSKSRYLDQIGRANVCRSAEEALYRAKELLRQEASNGVANNAVTSTFLRSASGQTAPEEGRKPNEGAGLSGLPNQPSPPAHGTTPALCHES